MVTRLAIRFLGPIIGLVIPYSQTVRRSAPPSRAYEGISIFAGDYPVISDVIRSEILLGIVVLTYPDGVEDLHDERA